MFRDVRDRDVERLGEERAQDVAVGDRPAGLDHHVGARAALAVDEGVGVGGGGRGEGEGEGGAVGEQSVGGWVSGGGGRGCMIGKAGGA